MKYRVLILGRANSGKTTILERLAGSSESDAQLWRKGKQLKGKTVKGQQDRGLHHIEDEIRFPSNERFIFHDSRGFEAGSEDELNRVKTFIESRCNLVTSLDAQLHAIWMCLPLNENRPLLEKEKEMLSLNFGSTPLVILFTKRDGLELNLAAASLGRETDATVQTKADKVVADLEREIRGLVDRHHISVSFMTTTNMHEKEGKDIAGRILDSTESNLTKDVRTKLLFNLWAHNIEGLCFWTAKEILQGAEVTSKDMILHLLPIVAYDGDDRDYYRLFRRRLFRDFGQVALEGDIHALLASIVQSSLLPLENTKMQLLILIVWFSILQVTKSNLISDWTMWSKQICSRISTSQDLISAILHPFIPKLDTIFQDIISTKTANLGYKVHKLAMKITGKGKEKGKKEVGLGDILPLSAKESEPLLVQMMQLASELTVSLKKIPFDFTK